MNIRRVISLLIIFCFCIVFPSISDATTKKESQSKTFQPIEILVILERMYVDGEYSQEEIKETVWSLEDFWAKYEDWQLIEMEERKVVFREYVDDISPLLKTNGYFGISDDGALTIFNGKPGLSKIIHTFFQLDIDKLESARHNELKKGIPIISKENYVEVLETFQNYTN